MTLLSPPPVRTDVSAQLRSIVLAHIAEQGMEAAEVAEALGVLPSTADSLLARNPWDIELAISAADRLGIDVHVDPVRGGGALDGEMASASSPCSICAFSLWIPLATLPTTAVGLYDDSRFPGRCIVALRRHEEHFEDVAPGLMARATAELKIVALAIKAVSGAERLNYALLGNTESHVHWHVIPRFPEQENLPGSSPWDDPRPRSTMPAVHRDEIAAALTGAIVQRASAETP